MEYLFLLSLEISDCFFFFFKKRKRKRKHKCKHKCKRRKVVAGLPVSFLFSRELSGRSEFPDELIIKQTYLSVGFTRDDYT